ncbi:hypothetical protein ABZU76_02175 [Amycolatopsis sp. NPDC005232]|uniref:hypothetical protein n=1 Tax=Amycolatopsis sp. NPDC005232 TaxID=3157027 RepID=UPI0033B234CB
MPLDPIAFQSLACSTIKDSDQKWLNRSLKPTTAIFDPVWDGHTFTVGHNDQKVPGLGPVSVFRHSYRNPRQVRSWWTVAPYSILARVGEDFDELQVPSEYLSFALQHGGKSITDSRIVRDPFGTRVFVTKGATLLPGLSNLVSIDLLPHGSYVPLPPTRLRGGTTTWFREPKQLDYQPGNEWQVQRVLLEVQRFWERYRDGRRRSRRRSDRVPIEATGRWILLPTNHRALAARYIDWFTWSSTSTSEDGCPVKSQDQPPPHWLADSVPTEPIWPTIDPDYEALAVEDPPRAPVVVAPPERLPELPKRIPRPVPPPRARRANKNSGWFTT